jgi:P63C domain
MNDSENEENPKVRAALARAAQLTSEERKAIARKGALARWDGNLPLATHESKEPLKFGDLELSCAVLQNKTRIITQASFLRILGRSRSPKAGTGVFSTVDELPFFLQAEALKPFISDELLMSTNPIFYRTLMGGRGVGYNATLLRQVAEVYLKLRDHQLKTTGKISKRYDHIIRAADVLIRGLADVGIVALVDHATGYERDRAKGDLEEILKRFVGDELRPWIKTFPDEYYEQIFRLRGLEFPKDSVKRPQYFGHLTKDIIYRRLAPGLWERLNDVIPRRPDGRLTVAAHRKLTENIGYRELLKLMGSVVTLMSLSEGWPEFMKLLDRRHPRYGETQYLPFEKAEPKIGL